MSKESYTRGFCKVAESAGVDPQKLAKFAQTLPPSDGRWFSGRTRKPKSLQSNPQQGRAIYRHLTKDEQKERFFPHWYNYLNPMNHIIAGAAMTSDRAPAR